MTDTDEQQEALEELDALPEIKKLAQAKLSRAWLVRRELKKLPDVLDEAEQVVNLARGEYDGREGLMAVTDCRVLFLEQGMMRHRFEDFRFDKITSVQHSTGAMSGKMTIFAAGSKHQIKDVHPKHRAIEIADYVRGQLGGASAVRPTPEAKASAETNGGDVMDQLRKLGELRDANVLTVEEFEAKKSELVARI